jgi:hypothetical protein
MHKKLSPTGKKRKGNKMNFTTIPGKLTLEEATAELVHVAQVMQRTHTDETFNGSRHLQQVMFEIRKTGIEILLNLIEQYIQQIPTED